MEDEALVVERGSSAALTPSARAYCTRRPPRPPGSRWRARSPAPAARRGRRRCHRIAVEVEEDALAARAPSASSRAPLRSSTKRSQPSAARRAGRANRRRHRRAGDAGDAQPPPIVQPEHDARAAHRVALVQVGVRYATRSRRRADGAPTRGHAAAAAAAARRVRGGRRRVRRRHVARHRRRQRVREHVPRLRRRRSGAAAAVRQLARQQRTQRFSWRARPRQSAIHVAECSVFESARPSAGVSASARRKARSAPTWSSPKLTPMLTYGAAQRGARRSARP